ncbi:DeoR/GlpR family DNA-binding transcription regulator [Allonocardiopsis opalescens]|uniref:DeoR family transcriptional regulator n=1 Tax=Allonocardiopsis opalescens TaxID=1144618 RepID=A0A2T0Q2W5_9ACTN|nr:DeoR/GlpR family DNA-binding transcription regulator [Allonocardiopsis opalescens]PRX98135.1 DeoR family transcriptional regulator [Allonocardiopsis opalescens]
MKRAERLVAIMEHLAREGSVAVSALSRGLGVSESSVRRDLNLLETQKWVSRTHGGAVARGTPLELQLTKRDAERAEREDRIARVAATRVRDGYSVGLVSGTAVAAVGRTLADRDELTVVTNAVDIAHQLLVHPQLRVVVTGGVADPRTAALSGSFTEAILDRVNLDTVFVQADGVAARSGLTADDAGYAQIAAMFVRRANQVIAILDSDRVGRACFTHICDLAEVDELITDSGADEDRLDQLASAGLQVTIA